MDKKYQICTKCVMDTTDSEIIFDEDGVCNHCHQYEEGKSKFIIAPEFREEEQNKLIKLLKQNGKNKQYDCIVGISGGVDSSYVAYLAKQWGLKALLVHLDNGWDSELAVKNIENIVKYTGFDLYTHVMNWEEFKDLQRSFFKADVIDLELLSDHAIFATVYKLARKYSVKYLLSGENFITEAIMAPKWNHRKSDLVNIKSVHKKYGTVKLKTFPTMSTWKKIFYQFGGLAQSFPVLKYVEYNKDKVINLLEKEFEWQYYGGKHYESLFTRFYQGYILPKKFGIDKRRAHLATLINSEQISRSDAIEELQREAYPIELQKEDFELVCKKLNFTKDELDKYINRAPKSHYDYDTDEGLFNFMRDVYKKFNLSKYNKY